jgi:hypothetical protein
MREDPTTRIGDTGEYEVAANFSRIGWGPVANTRRDLGTDVFVQARDARGFDLGLFAGVQVKSGDSFFDEDKEERGADGQLSGWRYYEKDSQHFDDWVTHGLPHLLVLHDLRTRESFWAHVTASAVEITGEGARILVPAGNKVDLNNLGALLEVAATQKQGISFEGSAWRAAAAEIPPARRLRTALIAPRLIAPHRNVGFRYPISPEEAIALLLQCRVRDLEEFNKRHKTVPTIEQAATKRDWRWKFFAALAPAVLRGDHSQLAKCIKATNKQERRAAATVALAGWLMEEEAHDHAISLLEKFGDRAGPVDHAWVLSQLARSQAEIGKIDDARQNAVLALQSIAVATGEDATASAIRAAAASLLYYTADIRGGDLAEAVSASDHAVGWWRTQVQAWGLSDNLDRTFRKTMHDQSKRFGFEESGHNRLYSSILTSIFSGDHGAWSNATRLLSYNTLTSGSGTPPEIAGAIDDLRRCGARSALILATKYAWSWEPAEAVQGALQRVAALQWCHTSASSSMALIQHGGDLATASEADLFTQSLLTIVRDPSKFVARVSPSFTVQAYVLDALEGVAASCSPETQTGIAQHLADLPITTDVATSNGYMRIAARLERLKVGADLAGAILASAQRQTDLRLSAQLLRIVSDFDAARDVLLQRAKGGDWDALSALGDVRTLTTAEATSLAAKDAVRIRQIMEDAEAGSFALWSHDSACSAAILGAWFNDAVDWQLLVQFIKHPHVAGEHKRNCCFALAQNIDRLPQSALELLREAAPHLRDAPFDVLLGQPLGGAGIYLAAALGTYDEDALSKQLAGLLTSSSEHRADSVLMIGHLNRADLIPISVGLVMDANPQVRLAAATSLAIHALKSGDAIATMAAECLRGIVRLPGSAMALRVANALYGQTSVDSQIVKELANGLSLHSSALVRRRVSRFATGGAEAPVDQAAGG